MNDTRFAALLSAVCFVAACGDEAPATGDRSAAPPSQPEVPVAESTATLTVGETAYDFPMVICQIRGDNALVQTRDGMSGYAFQTDVTQTRVSFQRQWETREGTMQEQWDVRRPDFTMDDVNIRVTGTVARIGQWRVLESGNRERVPGVERTDQPFTLTATCRD